MTQCLGSEPRGTCFALASKSFFSSTGGGSLLQGPHPFPPPQMNGPGHGYPFQLQQPPTQPPGPHSCRGKAHPQGLQLSTKAQSDPLGLRSLLYVFPSFLGTLTRAASPNHPCRSWRMCPGDHCSCLDPQVDSAPWGEMLFLKGFAAFIFSVPRLC